MLSAADAPEAPALDEETSDEAEEEDDAPSSNAEPYRMGRRLLIGSGGPTMSAPGRAVKRADRRDGFADEVDEVGVDEDEDDDAKLRRTSRAALVRKREHALDVGAARTIGIVIDVNVDDDMLMGGRASDEESERECGRLSDHVALRCDYSAAPLIRV